MQASFHFHSFLAHESSLQVLQAIRVECRAISPLELLSLDFAIPIIPGQNDVETFNARRKLLFNEKTSIARRLGAAGRYCSLVYDIGENLVTVDEFRKRQFAFATTAARNLKVKWIPNVANACLRILEHVGIGWLDLSKADLSMSSYESSKLKRMITMTKLVLQDSVLNQTINCINSFVAMLTSRVPRHCDITGPSSVKHTVSLKNESHQEVVQFTGLGNRLATRSNFSSEESKNAKIGDEQLESQREVFPNPIFKTELVYENGRFMFGKILIKFNLN